MNGFPRTSPNELEARLRATLPSLVVPVFDQALLKTGLWLSELSAELLKKGEKDIHDKDAQGLHASSERAKRSCRLRIEALAGSLKSLDPGKPKAATLSLIDETQMDMQLAIERLVEKLSYLHRKGLAAADQRITQVMGAGPYGQLLPFSPLSLADALRESLSEVEISEEFRALVVRHFEAMIDPVLSDFLRDLNAYLAGAGVLPELIIQDEEERRRREKIKVSRDAKPPEDTPAAADEGEAKAQEQAKHGGASESDRSLFASLVDLLGRMRHMFSSTPPPTRPLAPSETLSALDMMKAEAPGAVLEAISRPDGSIAEAIKRGVRQNAAKMGISGDGVGLSASDETAVEVTGHLFEFLLKDKPNAQVMAPILASLVTPIVKAAMADPELFIQRHHPARQLIETISEAVDDNTGDNPQDKALLQHAEAAVKLVNEDSSGDLVAIRKAEEDLSVHVQAMRKRAVITEKRAGETQGGQERLEIARREAAQALASISADRELPRELQEFLAGHWKHHMSITALRKGVDSDDWRQGLQMARRWTDLLDLASLGEALPPARLDELREPTRLVMATSGVQDDSAHRIIEELSRAVVSFGDEPVAAPAAREPASSGHEAVASAAGAGAMPASAAPVASTAEALAPPPAPRTLTEQEKDFVQSLAVGTLVNLTSASGARQNAKVSWISGISGLVMFVNRRGARIMALSPQEIIEYRERGELSLMDWVSPVDDAMHQLLEKLKSKMPALD